MNQNRLPNFNKFRMKETYTYYDEPLIFGCEAESQLYLGYVWEKLDEYIFVRTSPQDLKELEDHKITLRDFIIKSRDKFVNKSYKVQFDKRKVKSIEVFVFDDKNEDYPYEGVFLDRD